MGSRVRRIGMAVASVVAMLAVVAGCAGRGSVAAYVGGDQISVDQLQQTTDAVNAASQTPLTQQQVLSVLVQGSLADDIPRAKGYSLSDQTRDQAVYQLSGDLNLKPDTQASILDDANAQRYFYSIADAVLVAQRLGGLPQLVTAAKSYPVRINPRYGQWVVQSDQMGITSSGSLSQPAANASQPS